jgi:pyruvate,water dikinase
MVDAGMLETVPTTWEAEHKPRLDREIRRLAGVDLAALDDDALHAHLRAAEALGTEAMTLHFHLFVPYMVGVHELVKLCDELLGMSLPEVMQLLQGLSEASTASTRELAEVAALVRMSPVARAALAQPDAFERLTADPAVGDALRRWMDRWGLRTIGYDPGQPSFAERPSLVMGLLAELVEGARAIDLAAKRTEAVAAARRRLSGEERERFDRALAFAEVVYPQREDNVLYTDNLPAGVVRLAGLEMGRRLVERGRLARATDMAMLSFDEMRSGADLRSLVAKRRSEIAWVRAHPGPACYGPPPGAAPDLRGLPAAARRLNAALLWALEEELGPPRSVEGEGIRGLAASPGMATARVRVIRSAAEIEKLRAGEVLVCPITTPAWTLVFPRAAALVTDGGSILSHAAIVAREHGIPAVVGTGDATRRLRDGQTVTVDGNRGVVRVGSSGIEGAIDPP